ncbi:MULTISPECIES: hypothetical protein [Actinoalloteichus]|uniref:Uncharacterized protein n=1 Tax=Actinoalloteichus fjordicus TaxID=1612552 RepID=A0AAC9PUK2_9PSEU|nr:MULTISPECIES: hypothetical protein [Actinoalloteichus]APU17197.1 hypothetical protein UA74_25960 [Actinoalloteichus fjordicus]APU23280.1 hypothetical protein UA75_26545 [Actinoalloteichus sp. GBA129-24]
MTPDDDMAIPAAAEEHRPSPSRARHSGHLAEEVITRVNEPRRFALRELRDDIDGPVVFAWGLSMGRRSVLCHPDGTLFATSGRAEDSVGLGTGAGRRVELVWLE